MQFVLWMAELAWKLLLVGFGFWLFKWILGDGKVVIRTMVKTLALGIKAGCKLLQIKLEEKTKKKEPEDSEDSDIPTMEPVKKGEPKPNDVKCWIL